MMFSNQYQINKELKDYAMEYNKSMLVNKNDGKMMVVDFRLRISEIFGNEL